MIFKKFWENSGRTIVFAQVKEVTLEIIFKSVQNVFGSAHEICQIKQQTKNE